MERSKRRFPSRVWGKYVPGKWKRLLFFTPTLQAFFQSLLWFKPSVSHFCWSPQKASSRPGETTHESVGSRGGGGLRRLKSPYSTWESVTEIEEGSEEPTLILGPLGSVSSRSVLIYQRNEKGSGRRGRASMEATPPC